MFTEKFAWEYSAIYMTGFSAGMVLLLLFTLCICVVYGIFYVNVRMQHYRSKKYKPTYTTVEALSPSLVSLTNLPPPAVNCLKLNNLRVLASLIVLFLDMMWMSILNIGYVIIVVYVRETQALLFVAQVILAMSKLYMNQFLLWKLYREVKRLMYRYIHLKFSENVESDKEKRIEAEEDFVHTMTSKGMVTMVCAMLFNNIFAPCLSVTIVSPSCFYNAFFAAPTLSSQYPYCNNFFRFAPLALEGVCVSEAVGTTTLSPPFIYSYNCASLLPVNYTAVYVYMAIMGGIIGPLVKVLVKYFAAHYVKTLKEEDQDVRTHHQWISRLPLYIQPLTQWPSSLKEEEKSYDFRFLQKSKFIHQRIFDKNRFIVQVTSFLAILFSFGVLFPPLMIVLALAIISVSLFEQWNIGDILSRSQQLGFHWYWYKLAVDLEGIGGTFLTVILPMTMVSCLLFAFLLFDTFGDAFGLSDPITVSVPILIGCIPVFAHLACKFYVKKQKNLEKPLTSAIEMKRISSASQLNDIVHPCSSNCVIDSNCINPLYVQERVESTPLEI
jgi:hypothetical protein